MLERPKYSLGWPARDGCLIGDATGTSAVTAKSPTVRFWVSTVSSLLNVGFVTRNSIILLLLNLLLSLIGPLTSPIIPAVYAFDTAGT